jgi:hypothetical protein
MIAPVTRNHFGDQIDKSDQSMRRNGSDRSTEAVVNPPDQEKPAMIALGEGGSAWFYPGFRTGRGDCRSSF